jgi:hypothetical protein
MMTPARPELLPGKSARYWLRIMLAWYAVFPVLLAAEVVLASRDTWAATQVVRLGLVWCAGALAIWAIWLRRYWAEHRRGYSTLLESSRQPHLWILDAVTGEVITAPRVRVVPADAACRDLADASAVPVIRRSDFVRRRTRIAVLGVLGACVFACVVGWAYASLTR